MTFIHPSASYLAMQKLYVSLSLMGGFTGMSDKYSIAWGRNCKFILKQKSSYPVTGIEQIGKKAGA